MAGATEAGHTPWRPGHNPWAIAAAVALAAFMEVLDTSIANVALPYMAGNLGASNDESTWVLTSYLASNAIILPISGWIAGMFGRKRYFLFSIALFTMSSLLCGIATSLGLLIIFRALQGAGGGGLQPMAQAIMADSFPPEKRGLAFALYALVAVLAPTIGPTLGGWITDNYSWRWIFFINLPVGILAAFLVVRLVEDPPHVRESRTAGVKLDYIGISLLTLGIGALQVVLDKGQEDDWFGSRFITTFSIIAAVCLVSLVIWEWFRKDPIIDIRLFKNFNYATANLMMFVLGIVYFSSLVIIPQFLQNQLGYTAESAGLALSASGFALLLLVPVSGQLTTRVQARYLVAFGWLAIALAMYYSLNRLDLLISFRAAAWISVAQRVGLPFLFVPITLVVYIGIPPEKSSSAAGMINFMRNIGSSIGTSFVTTVVARREQLHQNNLVSHTSNFDPNFRDAVSSLTAQLTHSGLSPTTAQAQAYDRFYGQVQAQAATLSYIDVFWLLMIGATIMFFASFALKKNEPGGGGEVAVG
jgi:MFS transporter, DHA2 family, multidrug resistance protein